MIIETDEEEELAALLAEKTEECRVLQNLLFEAIELHDTLPDTMTARDWILFQAKCQEAIGDRNWLK